MAEYGRVRRSMVEYGRVWWSMVEYCRVWQSMAEYGRVWQSMVEYWQGMVLEPHSQPPNCKLGIIMETRLIHNYGIHVGTIFPYI